jgi:HJR/Mrr/RecB family endonuclease
MSVEQFQAMSLPPFQNRSSQNAIQQSWATIQRQAVSIAINANNQRQRNAALLTLSSPPEQSEVFSGGELVLPETQMEIARLSPSFGVLARILSGGIELDRLHWREFEELLADLLTRDGYSVELGPGTKDGGKDLVAIKDMGELGMFASVWQAKKLTRGRKLQEHVLRELADTRDEMKAGKGVIATTTYLTKGALNRVTRDRYILGKVDRDDLLGWIAKITS